MNISPAKENILKKIRQALTNSTPIPFPKSEGNSPIFTPVKQELEVEFADQFTKLQGRFIFCTDHRELAFRLRELTDHRKWKQVLCREEALRSVFREEGLPPFSEGTLSDCDAAISSCELLIARTGTIVMSAAQQSGRTVSVYAPVHLCVAYSSQMVYDIKEGLQKIKDKYHQELPSLITFATGPSRTADIEKTLVVGVHGPKEVFLFLVDEVPKTNTN